MSFIIPHNPFARHGTPKQLCQDGCGDHVHPKDRNFHQQRCPNAPRIPCHFGCGSMVLAKEDELHWHHLLCPNALKYACPYKCGWMIPIGDEVWHYQSCPRRAQPTTANFCVMDQETQQWHQVQLPLRFGENINQLLERLMLLVHPCGKATPVTHQLFGVDRSTYRLLGPVGSPAELYCSGGLYILWTPPSAVLARVFDDDTSTWHRVLLPLPCPENISELWQMVMRLVDPYGHASLTTHHLVIVDAVMRVVGPFTSVEQVGLGYLLKLFRLQKPPPPRSDVAANHVSTVATEIAPGSTELLESQSWNLLPHESGHYELTPDVSRHDDHPPPRSPRRGPSGPQLRRADEWIKRWYAAEEKGQEEHAKDERPALPDLVREIPAAKTTQEGGPVASVPFIHHEQQEDSAINRMVMLVVNNFLTLFDPAEPNASISCARLQYLLQNEHGELYDEVINGLFNRKFHKFVAEKTHLFVFNYTEYEIEAAHMNSFRNSRSFLRRFPPYLCAADLRVSTSFRPVVLEADRKQSARFARFLMESLDRHSLDTSPTSFWKMLSGVQQRKISKRWPESTTKFQSHTINQTPSSLV